jgi:hypothetical protein
MQQLVPRHTLFCPFHVRENSTVYCILPALCVLSVFFPCTFLFLLALLLFPTASVLLLPFSASIPLTSVPVPLPVRLFLPIYTRIPFYQCFFSRLLYLCSISRLPILLFPPAYAPAPFLLFSCSCQPKILFQLVII